MIPQENEVVVAVIAGTAMMLLLSVSLVIAVVIANRNFRRGIQWARENSIPKAQTPKDEFFMGIEKVLIALNYHVEKNDGQYLQAISTHVWDEEKGWARSAQGKRKINLNYDKDYIFFGIREDYDTRYVFNGYIETLEDIIEIDRITKLFPK